MLEWIFWPELLWKIQEQLNIQIELRFHGYFSTVMNVKNVGDPNLRLNERGHLDEIRRSFVNQSGFYHLI